MELFTVSRYTEEFKSSATDEDILLQKLLRKAEKRKRKQEQQREQEEQQLKPRADKLPETINDSLYNNCSDTEIIQDKQPQNDIITKRQEAESADEVELQVLGEDIRHAKRQHVEMVLPDWIAHPTIISTNLPKTNDKTKAKLGAKDDAVNNLSYLIPQMRVALKKMGITRLFPVQTTVVPWILAEHDKPYPLRPRDVCVSAPTGSGKTLAFAIPVIQMLATRVECKIRALIVLPVAELASQIFQVVQQLCSGTVLKVCLLSKQTSLDKEQNNLVQLYREHYYSNADIVVATPGRLVEHLHSTKGFCLKALRFLIIDEADRIMDAIFQNWLYHFDIHVRDTTDQLFAGRAPPLNINQLMKEYNQPHKMLFSATLSHDPEQLENLRLFQPKLFTSMFIHATDLSEKLANSQTVNNKNGEYIGRYTTPAELIEKYCITEARLKPLTLYALVKEHKWKKFLCFTNSTNAATRLAFVLTELFNNTTDAEMTIKELSANLSPYERTQTLTQFHRGKINGLIASDALARGIDVFDVDIVISYDQPRHIKTYIHRVGRTARAGRSGTAITLLTQNEQKAFNKILIEVGRTLTEEINVSDTIELEYARAYASALKKLRNWLEYLNNKKIMDKKRNERKSRVHKNPVKMTLMEKLQQDIHTRTEVEDVSVIKLSKEAIKPKLQLHKLNPNASKHKKIAK